MTRPATNNRIGPVDGIDLAIGIGLGALLAVGIAQWLTGNLAALLGRGRLLHATPIDAIKSLPRLMKHVGDPAAAWPARVRANLPGPVPYWIAAVLVFAAVAGLGLAVVALLGRHRQVPIDKRRRLGVATQPRLATRRDLAPLYTRRPEPNRFVLARYHRGYLSTEAAHHCGRRGVAGAVAVFGPSQSGKTTGLIDGITAWTGPAVVSSVKADLLRATLDTRRQRGEVRVFDPLGVTGLPSSTWSPLRTARSLSGALAAAGILARTGADDTTPGDKFWRGQAEQLLAAMLFTAANTPGHTMRHVVRWVLDLDRPDDSGNSAGTLAPLVRLLTDFDDPQVALSAKQVQGWLHGQWNTDPRTTSSVYATARTAVWPWADPAIATSAEGCELTLDWLLAGPNTLYLVAPLGDDTRIGLVFAAVLHDLISDAFTTYNHRGAPLNPRLLVVCDEAANTPLPKLPQWSATVSGAGIQLVTVWQSRAQLDETYGRQADGLLTNHRSKLFYPSGMTDTTTTDYLSVLAGTEHVRADLMPRPLLAVREDSDRASVATAVPYAPAHVLRRLHVGDAVLVHGQLLPAWIPASREPSPGRDAG
jgi:type IV secretion system protein VirD4